MHTQYKMHKGIACSRRKLQSTDQFELISMLDCTENYAFLCSWSHLILCLFPSTEMSKEKILLCKCSSLYKLSFTPFAQKMEAHLRDIFDFQCLATEPSFHPVQWTVSRDFSVCPTKKNQTILSLARFQYQQIKLRLEQHNFGSIII